MSRKVDPPPHTQQAVWAVWPKLAQQSPNTSQRGSPMYSSSSDVNA